MPTDCDISPLGQTVGLNQSTAPDYHYIAISCPEVGKALLWIRIKQTQKVLQCLAIQTVVMKAIHVDRLVPLAYLCGIPSSFFEPVIVEMFP